MSQRGNIATFYKTAGGRLIMDSLIVLEEVTNHYDGKQYISRDYYDVDYSRAYGYLYHMSGGGGSAYPIKGIYFTIGDVGKLKEEPTDLVDANDNPPWGNKKTRVIRKRNRTRRLSELPKAFDLEPGWDVLDWLENRAIQDEAVWCSTCRDYYPGEQLCKHCWWCDKTGWYSTPDERCKCKDRDECSDK